jgi:hypothetical protein
MSVAQVELAAEELEVQTQAMVEMEQLILAVAAEVLAVTQAALLAQTQDQVVLEL